ncbi:MAG: glycosyltransferase, partial [Saprospiraceae bacterium]|nr:glycosyltransferase [Saprospiraceae bacterium]
MNKKAKILFLSSVFKVGYGVGLVIRQQAKYLHQAGYDNLHIGSFDQAEAPFYMHYHKVAPNQEVFNSFLKELQPDIILVHTPPFFQLVTACSLFKGLKIAYDHGDPYPELFPNDSKQRAEIEASKRLALRSFHAHISISEFIKSESSVLNSKVIYNGVDHIEPISPNHDTESLASWLEYPEGTRVIAGLSRIGEGERHYKGYDLFIAVKEALEKRLPNESLAFIFMGRAVPPGNEVEALLSKAGIKILENVSETDKRRVLSGCDLFLSTSIWEGFNLPLAEAQYLGAPSAAFSVGAHPEVCPFHFPNIFELTTFAKELLTNQAFRNEIGNQQQAFVQSQFIWDNNGAQLEKFLHNLDYTSARVHFQIGKNSNANQRKVLKRDLKRRGLLGQITLNTLTGKNALQYTIPQNEPSVSIIIPNQNHFDDLHTCIKSITERTTYKNYEIIIAENGSSEQNVLTYYQELETKSNVTIVHWKKPFNYAAINNFSVSSAKGEVYIFLNNDTEVKTPDWIERMLEYALRPEIGAVGAKLLFPDGTIQHGGIVIGINGVASNVETGKTGNANGYMDRLNVVHELSAVTGACLMCKKTVFDAVKGFDE